MFCHGKSGNMDAISMVLDGSKVAVVNARPLYPTGAAVFVLGIASTLMPEIQSAVDDIASESLRTRVTILLRLRRKSSLIEISL